MAWFATTPEGEKLGRLAAEMVRTEWRRVPLWLAPIEPFRWLISLLSTGYPHAKWLAVVYGFLALAVGLTVFWRWRTLWWHRTLVATTVALNTLLTLAGGYIAVSWLHSVLPVGRHWVVPSEAPFILANLHTHTTQSNGFLTPEQALLWHYRRGYRVVAITDSNTVRGGELARSFAERTKLPITVLAGEEFRGSTHLVLLNIRQDLSPRHFDVPAAIAEAKRQGGFVIAAHPWTSRHHIADLIAWGIEGMEIANNATLADERLRKLCQQHRLTAVASLDFRGGYRPAVATVLPREATTPEKVAQALREGKCAALYLPPHLSPPGFQPLQSWWGELCDLWRTGWMVNLTGLLFWFAVLWWWRQRFRTVRRREQSWRFFIGASLFTLAAFVLTAGLGVWAMGREFKEGWFPPLPLVIAVWAVLCPANWWMWGQMAFAFAPAVRQSGRCRT